MKHTLLTLLLCGCAYVSPASLIALARLDPLSSDPALMAVRAELPAGIDMMPGSVRLSVEATHDADGTQIRESYTLERRGTVWRLSENDAARMRAVQRQVRTWKAGAGASGSFSAHATPCIRGEGPAPNATFSLLMQTDPDAAFAPVLRNVPLNRIEPGALPPCMEISHVQ